MASPSIYFAYTDVTTSPYATRFTWWVWKTLHAIVHTTFHTRCFISTGRYDSTSKTCAVLG